MISMATIGRPARRRIRSEVVSSPGAAIEVTVFHIPANIVKEQPVRITRCRFNLKNIFRMLGQILNQIFQCRKPKPHTPSSLPAPIVTITTPNPGNSHPNLMVDPGDATIRTGNFFELYRATLADMSNETKISDLEISEFLLAYVDDLPATGTYYYRARERNAGSTDFSPYSVKVTYVAAT